MSLLAFKEKIDPEFPGLQGQRLIKKALKTDAEKNSLKQFLGVQSLKSCDYISFKGSKKLWLIEFTDLKKQEDNIYSLISKLKNKVCTLDPNNERKCVKKETVAIDKSFKVKNLISNELRQKCIETTLLVHKILDRKKISYAERFESKIFLVVVNQIAPMDSIAMESLRLKLQSGLSGIVDRVRIVPQDKFEVLFGNN